MTRLHPEERPSKDQVARDLAAWGEMAAQPVVFDLSEARARLRDKLRVEIAEQDAEEQRKNLAQEAVRRLQELTAPLNAELKNLHPRTEVDSVTDQLTRNTVRSRDGMRRRIVDRWQRCTIVAPDDRPMSTTLRMSRCLELSDDGLLLLHMLVLVAPRRTMGNYFSWEPGERSAPVGSVEAEKMLEDSVRELTDALSKAVDVFIEHVQGAAGND